MPDDIRDRIQPTRPGWKYTIGGTMGAMTLQYALEQKRNIIKRFGRAPRDVKIVLNATGQIVTRKMARELAAEEQDK